jgi:hypothetical protein
MFTRTILVAILAACAAPTGAANSNQPDERDPPKFVPPPDTPQEIETHWCCDEITGPKSGEGCGQILLSQGSQCANWLNCTNGHTKKDGGSVTCH